MTEKKETQQKFWQQMIYVQQNTPIIKKLTKVTKRGVSRQGNKFEYDYYYSPLEQVQQALHPVLSDAGL
jgi:hypothetical protein